MPTRGENFGHAIFESLQVGTPVLLSDQTPWRHNIQNGIQAISIKNEEQWIEAIEFWAQMPKSEMGKYRLAAYNYAKKYIVNSKSAEKTKKLFDYAFNQIEII